MATRPRRPSASPRETLFSAAATERAQAAAPLAARMRPRNLEELAGQRHLLLPGSALRAAIESDRVRSMILWGPPGSGKTTLARIIADATQSHFAALSAVTAGVGDIQEVVAQARDRAALGGQRTTLFVDEVHRFNKSQQDALLPHVEDGTLVLVAATTENPSFAINAALLSRCVVLHLEPLSVEEVIALLERALVDDARGLGSLRLTADAAALRAIAERASGDARRALSILERIADSMGSKASAHISLESVAAAELHRPLLYDKSGEEHYNVVSAFIKSMRGSDPDASIYWMMRMLEAGDDPLFVSRRMVIFASEDVGNADPRALMVAVAADEAVRRVGMPEAHYALAQASVYLACAPKSNAAGRAWQRAKEAIAARGSLPVPKKLRNAPTPLMREEGYGGGYRYPHDAPGGFLEDERYLPDGLGDAVFYEPTDRGEEEPLKGALEARRTARSRR